MLARAAASDAGAGSPLFSSRSRTLTVVMKAEIGPRASGVE